MCEGLKKQLAVGVVEKDLLASIAPTGHMINRTGKLQPSGRATARLYQLTLLDCNT